MPLNPESNLHLITGMAGVGKSTTRMILAERGHQTINLDTYRRESDDLRLGYWGTDDGAPTDMPEDPLAREKLWSDRDWLEENYWRWRPEVMMDLILEGHDHETPTFVDGRARNQEEFFPFLGTVVLLRTTETALREKLDVRKDDASHQFGQHPVTRQFLVDSMPEFERRARNAGAVLFDVTNLSRERVADEVVTLSLGPSSPGA